MRERWSYFSTDKNEQQNLKGEIIDALNEIELIFNNFKV